MLKNKNILDKFTNEETFQKNTLFWDYLSKNAYPLTKGELRIPISLEPFELSEINYNDLKENLVLIIESAKKVINEYFKNDLIKKALNVSKFEEELLKISKNQDLLGIIRADLFYSKNPKLIELNTDFPDGFFMHDITIEALLFNFDKSHYTNLSHSEIFVKLLEDINIKEDDHIFIGYNKTRFFKDEFELSRLELRKLGYTNISVGPLEDLDLKDDNSFYYNNKKVDFIRRGSEISKLRKNKEFIGKLKKNISMNPTPMINNFKMRLLGHKNLLSLLHKKDIQKLLSKEEIIAINKLIPKTYSILEIKSFDNFKLEKDKWVLKASDLAEGEDVYLGIETDQNIWNELLIKSKENPTSWILQEKVEIPTKTFTILNEETQEIKKEIKKFDFNPHIILFKNKIDFGNILVRYSDSSVLNVMKGGGITYTLIKKENFN